MKNIHPIIILFFILTNCTDSTKTASVYDFIPEKASVIITINDIENIETNIKNNAFINEISKASVYKSISKRLKPLNYIKTTNPVVVSLLKDENDSLQFTIITKQINALFALDSLPNFKSEIIKIGKNKAKKITFNTTTLYTVFKDSIAIGSSSSKLLESVLNSKNKNETLNKITQTHNTKKPISVVLNNESNSIINSLFNLDSISFKDFTDYTSFDAEISQDAILLNGITKAKDSTKKVISIFKNTMAQENQMAKIAPNNCDGFLSFTFNDFTQFKNQLNVFNKKQDSTINTSLFDNIIEIGTIYQGKNKVVVLNSIDAILTKEQLLGEQNNVETYRQVAIFGFSKPEIFKSVFQPLISFNAAKYYCVIDQFFVFANNKDALENIIANYQNKTTLSSREYYKNVMENLSRESSILHVLNDKKLKQLVNINLGKAPKINFSNYKISALQFIADSHYAHFHAALKKNKAKVETHTVNELLNIKLEVQLLTNPQFVTNHTTKGKEIVVQDINNKLYLISNKGNIIWKKQLNGAILGNVKQIDRYKNGKLQLVFATQNSVYMLDRNGKDAEHFPLKFKDKITQPLSVFDYDKNKNYRLFVTQNKNILVYNAKGKTVKGFGFSKTKTPINTSPKHFRINNKDYIVIKTKAEFHILNRRGKTRVKVNKTYNYSNQPVFVYKNKFTTTSKNGSLISIDQSGRSTNLNIGLLENHTIKATAKTLVAMTENKLIIKDKTLELDFGNYTKPKLFLIKNKIYISVTDLQTQKIYLYNSNAKLLPNFPVYGISAIDLNNMDKNSKLEFTTKGENNSILVYRIN